VADSVKFSILGIEDIEMKLRAVSLDARFTGGRNALRKAAIALSEKVRDNSSRVDNPLTKRSIPANVTVRWNRKRFDSTGSFGYRVGIRGGAGGNKPSEALAGNPGGDTRYWRHLEFGTSKTRAQPFMRKSLADNINLITDTFIQEFNKSLTRVIRKGR
jgi:HK97 gp10 family phage protein